MSGLLTAHVLRKKNPVVYEAQAKLPNNHAALLRFRTNAVAEATGIPFKRVQVQKAIWDGEQLVTTPTLFHNNQYSLKVSGRATGRSILNLDPVERYIAPPDFIARLSEGVDIKYNSPFTGGEEGISTIPMPTLAKILGVEVPVKFESKEIWTHTVAIEYPEINLYQTIYFTQPDDHLYRASLTGSTLTLEYTTEPYRGIEPVADILLNSFGLNCHNGECGSLESFGIKKQKFGKLLSVDDEARRTFILYATDKFGIYSVGRFATWRQILLDDVVKDIGVVEKIMNQIDRYGTIKTIHAQ